MIPLLTQCNSYIIIYQFQLPKFNKGINKLSSCNKYLFHNNVQGFLSSDFFFARFI